MSVGAFCAQADAKPVSAEDVYAAMVQAAKPVEADLAKRQATLPALGYLPANADAYVALAQVGQHIERAMSDGMLLDQPVEPAPPELTALESIAVSMSEGSAAGLRVLFPILMGAQEMIDVEEWVAGAKPADAQQMRTVWEAKTQEQIQKSMEEFQHQWQLKPVYAVVTVNKAQARMVEEWSKMIISIVLASHIDTATPFEYGDFKGVKLKLVDAQHPALQELCVMTKICDNALVVAVCAKPEDVQLPGKIEDSALASPRLSACDTGLDDLLMVSYGSAAFMQSLDESSFAGLKNYAAVVRAIFESLGVADATRKEAFDKAAVGVNTLMEQMTALWSVGNKQDSMLLCRLNDKEFRLEFSENAGGSSYESGVLRYADQVAEPGNIFYCESTPYSSPASGVECGKIISSLLAVGKGYALTLPENEQKEVENELNFLETLEPECAQLGQAFSLVCEGLGRGGAVLVDAAGSLPTLFGGTKDNQVAMPRLACCYPVTNREKLAQGWDAIFRTMGGFAGKIFGSSELVNALAFPSKKVGDAVSYCLYMPICTEHMVPNVTVSDKCFVAGTSSAYNEKLAMSATGNTSFQGAVFSLKWEPLATTLRDIADAYASRIPAEEEAVPMSQVDAHDEMVSTAPQENATQLEMVSAQLEEWASSAEVVSNIIESIHGTITIDNGRRTIRTVVRLQK